jgi:hypothetical protein
MPIRCAKLLSPLRPAPPLLQAAVAAGPGTPWRATSAPAGSSAPTPQAQQATAAPSAAHEPGRTASASPGTAGAASSTPAKAHAAAHCTRRSPEPARRPPLAADPQAAAHGLLAH